MKLCPVCKKEKCDNKSICNDVIIGCGYYENGQLLITKRGMERYRILLEKNKTK